MAGRWARRVVAWLLAGVATGTSGCALAGLFAAPVDVACTDNTVCALDDPCVVGVCRGGFCTTAPRDDDHDGYADALCPPSAAMPAGDCAPADPLAHPHADEHCDEVDDDCDAAIDEACPRATAIACGDENTCVLREDGVVRCWGIGAAFGAPSTRVLQPTTMPLPVAATALAATGGGLCALTADGAVWCVGNALGTGATPPSAISFSGPATDLYAGQELVCATLRTGITECRGLVASSLERDAIDVAHVTLPGRAHVALTNAMICAADALGVVSCVGSDFAGALGQGPMVLSSYDWLRVAGADGSRGLACLPGVCCALGASDRLACWGGAFGWLGGAPTPTEVSLPSAPRELILGPHVLVPSICYRDTAGELACLREGSATPIAAMGYADATVVAAGTDFACGIDTRGVVRCSGQNLLGQLGTGDTDRRSNPTIVRGL